MRIVIAGGHGQIALLLERRLADAGHEPVALIRNPSHESDVVAAGAQPVLLDLESTDADALARVLAGADAAVFAAGAGPGSTPERKGTVDRDASVLLADAAVQAGVPRLVQISAMSADRYEADSDDIFQIYLRAKSEADARLRETSLEWTIVRPGRLTNEPATGAVTIGESVSYGEIPRDDVAAVIAELLVSGAGVRWQFDLVSGDTTVGEAVGALR
ncbi:NAD(P)H-binding protein [Agromyces mangrovi Wang et al. 2018]|uniref:NAD(P)H-binding protein n=1 Tax=Agromyces mangrovi TaxID=1858653 RepID=UPI0025727078|nr:NAD(P)H-binding protein [Agromyces mangrovi]